MKKISKHQLWSAFRFSVIGRLLSSPPGEGDLKEEIEALAGRMWKHPITGEGVQFSFSTIERWYYQARAAKLDPISPLRRKVRVDSGQMLSISSQMGERVVAQYKQHRSWSYKLHYDNLCAHLRRDASLKKSPSYSSIKRYMQSKGLFKGKRIRSDSEGRAVERTDAREIRSYENEYVNGLWHLDFHKGSKKVLSPAGEWMNVVFHKI